MTTMALLSPARFASTAFTPLSLSPALWVDSSDAATVTISGSSGAYIGADGLVLPGSATNRATIPNSAATQITGDIDIRVKATLTDWTPSAAMYLVIKYDGFSGSGYGLQVKTDGTLLLYIGTGSERAATSTAATGIADGTSGWVRATRESSSGTCTFYTSTDGSSWTPLGTTVAMASGAITTDTTGVSVGSFAASSTTNGTIARVQILNGIAGTTVFDANFEAATPFVSSFSESSSNAATVTVTSSTSGALVSQINDKSGNNRHLAQGTAGNMPTYTGAAQNGLNALTFDGTNDILTLGSVSISQPITHLIVAKFTNGDTNTRRMAGSNTTAQPYVGTAAGKWAYGASSDVDSGDTDDANCNVFAVLHNGASSQMWLNGASISTGSVGADAINALGLGGDVNGANYWAGTILEAVTVPSDASASVAAFYTYAKAKWGTT